MSQARQCTRPILRAFSWYRRKVFSEIYDQRIWGKGESLSGSGSCLAATERLRREISCLLRELMVASILDAPCGDFYWMKQVRLEGVGYTGVDIVPKIISANRSKYEERHRRFDIADITCHPLPTVDLVLCRDCFVHMSYREIFSTLQNFHASGSTYLLTTTFWRHTRNEDVHTGTWRPLNLENPPFCFPAPLRLIPDGSDATDGEYSDKSLGLWRLVDIPRIPCSTPSRLLTFIQRMISLSLNPPT